ncbi:MAG: AAA family ATPase [Bacteroidia bacterium]
MLTLGVIFIINAMNNSFISNLHITNYKSIKQLEVPCKRVNLFIGEPNAGKTNIIEALSFLAIGVVTPQYFREIIRFNSASDLFYDSDATHEIKIQTNLMNFTLEYNKNISGALLNSFKGTFSRKIKDKNFNGIKEWELTLNHDGSFSNNDVNFSTNITFYQFKKHQKFIASYRSFLNPPFGDNIPTLLISNQKLKKMVSEILKEKEMKLLIMPNTGEILFCKQVNDDTIYTYPYNSLSDTLQRIIFFLLAIETSNGHVLIFDEPEANMFPFYTQRIAKKIAQDKTNQYFLTTHNPYLLKEVIKNTPKVDLSVNIVHMENYETKMKILSQQEIEKAEKNDVFFDLDNIIRGKGKRK